MRKLAPISLSAPLLTLVILFGLQGEQILRQPLVIALLAVQILIQVYFNAGAAYWLNRQLGVEWCVAGPSALIGASNFFDRPPPASRDRASCEATKAYPIPCAASG